MAKNDNKIGFQNSVFVDFTGKRMKIAEYSDHSINPGPGVDVLLCTYLCNEIKN
jgi:hypothetical protein